mgnify:CR=1 FL=1
MDAANFSSGGSPIADSTTTPGEVLFLGNRITEGSGIAGDNIRLATVTFQRTGDGAAAIELVDRGTSDDFVLFDDDMTVLDDEIGTGVSLIVIQMPTAGDVNGDGTVDLADAVLTLQFLAAAEGEVVHKTGDASGDDAVGLEEGVWILQKIADLR